MVGYRRWAAVYLIVQYAGNLDYVRIWVDTAFYSMTKNEIVQNLMKVHAEVEFALPFGNK